MYPSPVDPTPTLTPSIRTLSPTLSGKVSPELNPVLRPTVTFWVIVLNPTAPIPIPLLFWLGRIIGSTLLIPLALLRILTLVSPKL